MHVYFLLDHLVGVKDVVEGCMGKPRQEDGAIAVGYGEEDNLGQLPCILTGLAAYR